MTPTPETPIRPVRSATPPAAGSPVRQVRPKTEGWAQKKDESGRPLLQFASPKRGKPPVHLADLTPEQRIDLLGLGERQVGVVVEVSLARVLVERGRLAGQLDAQQRPALALEDLALQLQQQRGGERRRADDDLLPLLDVEAVAGQ